MKTILSILCLALLFSFNVQAKSKKSKRKLASNTHCADHAVAAADAIAQLDGMSDKVLKTRTTLQVASRTFVVRYGTEPEYKTYTIVANSYDGDCLVDSLIRVKDSDVGAGSAL